MGENNIENEYTRPEPKPAELLADSLNNRAVSMLDLGSKEEAEKLYDQALQADPHHPEATYNRGLLLWRSGRMTDDELVGQLEEVRTTHQSDWTGEYLLGLVHLERGDSESAAYCLEQAKKQSPDNDDIKSALCSAQTNRGTKNICRTVPNIPEGSNQLCVWVISPNGKLAFARHKKDGKMMLWNIDNGKCLWEGPMHFKNCCFSTDGKYLLSTWHLCVDSEMRSDHYVLIYTFDVNNGNHLHAIRYNTAFYRGIVPILVSHDGSIVLSAYGRKLTLWDTVNEKCLFKNMEEKSYITSIALSKDCGLAVVGRKDGIINLLHITGSKENKNLHGHKDRIRNVFLTNEDKFLFSCSDDGTVKKWDISTGQCLNTFKLPKSPYYSIRVSDDGENIIAAVYRLMRLHFWDIRSEKCFITYKTDGDVMVSLSHDGKRAISYGAEDALKLYELSPGEPQKWILSSPTSSSDIIARENKALSLLREAEIEIESDNFSKAYGIIQTVITIPGYRRNSEVLALRQKLVKTSRARTFSAGWLARTLEGHDYCVSALAVTNDGKFIMSGEGISSDSFRCALRLWDISTGNLIRTFEGNKQDIETIALSRDARLCLSGSRGSIEIWDVQSGRCIDSTQEPGTVVSIKFLSNNRHFLYSAGKDVFCREISVRSRLWDICFSGDVLCIDVSVDGQFAFCGTGGHLVMIDLFKRKKCRSFDGHPKPVSCVSISPDQRFVLSGSWDKMIRLWEIISGLCIHTFEGHTTEVHSIAFTPDGRFAVSGGSRDRNIILWDIENRKLVRTFEGHTHGVDAVRISPDNRFIVSGSRDKTIKVWELVWDHEFPEPADWDEGAKPYLEIFLTLHCPYGPDGISRVDKPAWNDDDFKELLKDLQYRGYGWLRPGGVRKKLEEMTASWQGPPILTGD